MHHRPTLATFLLIGALADVLAAQSVPPPQEPVTSVVMTYFHDSGIQMNAGGQMQMLHEHTVQQPGAQALRVFFSTLSLGSGDYLEVTSPGAREHQRLGAAAAVRWNGSSAYFNGDTLVLRLWVRPGSAARFVTSRIDVGVPVIGTDTICGTTDDRVPTNDNRVCRILSSGTATGGGCTGWLASIDDCGITAGHCVSCCTGVAEFNVPLSSPTGAIQHPPASDQFPIDPTSVNYSNGGLGNDYAVFKILPNGVTQSPAQLYGWFTLGGFIPSPGDTIRITGFGSGGGQFSQTNRTHTGPFVSNSGTVLYYQVDTTGGNSGSPIIHESTGMAVGVHTNGGCTTGGGSNSGTSTTNPTFTSVYQAMCALSSFFFDLDTTGGGVRDLHMGLLNLPAGTVQGYTLFSFDTSAPVGSGNLLGLHADLVTLQILSLPGSNTDPLHWVGPFIPGLWPTAAIDVPAGGIPFTAGTSVDGVVVALGPNVTFLGATNLVRITF